MAKEAMEQAPWDAEAEAAAAEAKKVVQLRLPTFEGMSIETIEVGFGGSVKLNPAIEEDKQILEAIKFGREIEVTVYASASGVAFNIRRDTDGDAQVSGRRRLTVHSFDRTSIKKV